jgi:hypothetical protein
MIRIHAGNIDIHLKVMTDHESLHILIHNATESKENLRMISASVKFLKAGFMSQKPRCIAGIALYNFLNSVIKLLDFVLGSIDLLALDKKITCLSFIILSRISLSSVELGRLIGSGSFLRDIECR